TRARSPSRIRNFPAASYPCDGVSRPRAPTFKSCKVLHAKRRHRNFDSFLSDRLQALLQDGGEVPSLMPSEGHGSPPQNRARGRGRRATAAFLADNLCADGYRVFCASEAGEAVRALEVRQPDRM